MGKILLDKQNWIDTEHLELCYQGCKVKFDDLESLATSQGAYALGKKAGISGGSLDPFELLESEVHHGY